MEYILAFLCISDIIPAIAVPCPVMSSLNSEI